MPGMNGDRPARDPAGPRTGPARDPGHAPARGPGHIESNACWKARSRSRRQFETSLLQELAKRLVLIFVRGYLLQARAQEHAALIHLAGPFRHIGASCRISSLATGFVLLFTANLKEPTTMSDRELKWEVSKTAGWNARTRDRIFVPPGNEQPMQNFSFRIAGRSDLPGSFRTS